MLEDRVPAEMRSADTKVQIDSVKMTPRLLLLSRSYVRFVEFVAPGKGAPGRIVFVGGKSPGRDVQHVGNVIALGRDTGIDENFGVKAGRRSRGLAREGVEVVAVSQGVLSDRFDVFAEGDLLQVLAGEESMTADLFDTFGQLDRGDVQIAIQEIGRYADQFVRFEGHVTQFVAVLERVRTDFADVFRDFDPGHGAAGESRLADDFEAGGENDIFQRRASAEGSVADHAQLVAEGQSLERGAVFEGSASDRECTGQFDGIEQVASAEGSVANLGDR